MIKDTNQTKQLTTKRYGKRSRLVCRGFTFVEVLTVLGIITLATMGVLVLRDWATSNSRIAEAKSQIATIQAGALQWRPRSGLYDGISIIELASVAAIPAEWQSGLSNPWGGDIEVTVDSSDSTRFAISFSNIRQPEEGNRLVRDFSEAAVTSDFTASTFRVTFQG